MSVSNTISESWASTQTKLGENRRCDGWPKLEDTESEGPTVAEKPVSFDTMGK